MTTERCKVRGCRTKIHGKIEHNGKLYPVCDVHLTYMRTANKKIEDMVWKDIL